MHIKVLRVIARLNLGGPARCVINLATRLKDLGFETLVAAGSPGEGEGDMSEELLAAGGELRVIPGLQREISLLDDLRALRNLKKLVQEFRPDIVHTHTSKAGILGRKAAAAIKPVPLRVHTFHGHVLDGYFGMIRSDFFRRMERSLARKTDALVTVAPSVKRELLERHGVGRAEQYSVIPSGYPELHLEGVTSLREELGLGASVVAGLVGRLVPVKGIDLLIKTIPRILEDVKDLKLVVAGDGPLRSKLESFTARSPWADSIHILGNRKDIEKIFKTLDLLLLPSTKEGLPTVLLEAVAAGVPIAAARIPGVLDLFRDGVNAILFEPGSVADFAEAVTRLARDGGLRCKLAEKAAKDIPVKVPDYQGVAESHARLYQGLVEQLQT